MKPRFVTGCILALSGAVLLVLGLFGINGPAFYLHDAFLAEATALPTVVTGSAAIIIGAITLASTSLRRSLKTS